MLGKLNRTAIVEPFRFFESVNYGSRLFDGDVGRDKKVAILDGNLAIATAPTAASLNNRNQQDKRSRSVHFGPPKLRVHSTDWNVTYRRYTYSLHDSRLAAMKKPAKPDIRERYAGFAVRNRRDSLGLTQEELAARIGIHRTYLADIERGIRNVSLINIERIAAGLSLSMDELFKQNLRKPDAAGSIYGARSQSTLGWMSLLGLIAKIGRDRLTRFESHLCDTGHAAQASFRSVTERGIESLRRRCGSVI